MGLDRLVLGVRALPLGLATSEAALELCYTRLLSSGLLSVPLRLLLRLVPFSVGPHKADVRLQLLVQKAQHFLGPRLPISSEHLLAQSEACHQLLAVLLGSFWCAFRCANGFAHAAQLLQEAQRRCLRSF